MLSSICGAREQISFLIKLAAILTATSSGVLIIVFPLIVRQIVLMENELAVYMDVYTQISNSMWSDLVEQNTKIYDSYKLRREIRQSK